MDIRTQETEPSRPKSLMQRLGLSVLFLGCGLLVFIVSHFTSGELNVQTFWVPSLFLVAAIMTRRSARLNAHWQVFYAFFIFSFVWLFSHWLLSIPHTISSDLGGSKWVQGRVVVQRPVPKQIRNDPGLSTFEFSSSRDFRGKRGGGRVLVDSPWLRISFVLSRLGVGILDAEDG